MNEVVNGLLALLLIVVAVAAIVEISAREQLASDVAAATEGVVADVAAGRSEPIEMEGVLQSLQLMRYDVEALIATGTDHRGTSVQGLRNTLAAKVGFGGPNRRPRERSEDDPEDQQLRDVPYSRWCFCLPTRYGSNVLLVILLLSAGGLGSIIAALKERRMVQCVPFLSGVLAGFVVFLVVKGGRAVFLLETADPEDTFNPYTSALLGLLAGLYNDRAHLLLSSISEAIATRLERVVAESTDSASGTRQE